MALFRSYLYKFVNFNIIFTYLVTLHFCVHVVMVHFAMLKGIVRNVTTVPEGLIKNRVKLTIQRELLTYGVGNEALCQCLRYCCPSAHLVFVDGEIIPNSY